MAIDNETVANITDQNSYADRSKPRGPARPSYDQSVKIKDTGASTPPGQDARPAPFVNPDPKSKHRF